MARKYSEEFKKDAVRYVKIHKELSTKEAAKNLGIPKDTLYDWIKSDRAEKNPDGYTETGNQTELEKENLRLKRELRDAEDALEILKKAIGILGD